MLAGRVLRKEDQLGDTVTYDYDLAGRLEQRDYRTRANSPSGTIANSDSFTYLCNFKTGLLLLFSLALVSTTAAFGWRIWHMAIFARDREAGLVLVKSMRDHRPPNIPAESWEIAVNWTITAYQNVFFSADTPGSGDTRSFKQDATGIIKESEGFDAIQRLWERLAQSGPTGEEYVAKFYPDLLRDYSKSITDEPSIRPADKEPPP